MSGEIAAAAVDGGALTIGGGLLALLRPALDRLAPGGVLAVLSAAPDLRDDLPAWCRLEHHRYLGCAPVGGRDRHLLAAGDLARPQPPERTSDTLPAARPLTAAAALAALPMPAHASPASGFAPRGVAVEPGGPVYPFTLLDRDLVAPPEAAALYDQAVAGQWDASRDIPWEACPALEPAVETAVAQAMTFLAGPAVVVSNNSNRAITQKCYCPINLSEIQSVRVQLPPLKGPHAYCFYFRHSWKFHSAPSSSGRHKIAESGSFDLPWRCSHTRPAAQGSPCGFAGFGLHFYQRESRFGSAESGRSGPL